MELISHSLTPEIKVNGIHSLVGVGNLVGPLAHPVLYLRYLISQGYTSIYFGENQLFPSLFSLSPLPTPHPKIFQYFLVRPSTRFYSRFALDMGRSLGFGSCAQQLFRPFKTRFRFGFTC